LIADQARRVSSGVRGLAIRSPHAVNHALSGERSYAVRYDARTRTRNAVGM